MNNLEELYQMHPKAEDYGRGYVKYLTYVLRELDFAKIEAVIEVFDKARREGRSIYFIGNGGSAATCSHFANDLTLATRGTLHKSFRAISLCDNNALMTAVANDAGYENLFIEQLRPLANPGDVLVSISASGNSKNLIRAIEFARGLEIVCVGLAGFRGGQMKSLCDPYVHIPCHEGEYGPAEDAALVLDHLISTFLTYRIYGDKIGFRPGHVGY